MGVGEGTLAEWLTHSQPSVVEGAQGPKATRPVRGIQGEGPTRGGRVHPRHTSDCVRGSVSGGDRSLTGGDI